MWSTTLLLWALAGLTATFPIPVKWDPEQGDKFEGDMVLSAEQKLNIQLGQRNGLINEKYRWPENIVYYMFAEGHFDTTQQIKVLRGMRVIEENSCIRFYPAVTGSTKFLNISSTSTGCYSNVGFSNKTQRLNLQSNCLRLGVVVHELFHTLGFYHEQSSSDRDNFITIVYENVIPGREKTFNIYNSTTVTDFGVGYDYGSVMHYGPKAFSKNGENTIVTLDPDAKIGQRIGPSEKDIRKLNIMYKCPGFE